MFRIWSKVRLAKIIFCINQIDFYGSVIRVPSVISYSVDIIPHIRIIIIIIFRHVSNLRFRHVSNLNFRHAQSHFV